MTALLVVLPACGRGDSPVISGSPPAGDFSDEGREYAEFPNAPSPRMSFRVGNIGELSGIYSTEDEFNETNEWRPGATIQYVLVHD